MADYVIKVEPVAKPRMTRRDKWLDPPRPSVAKYWLFADLLRLAFRQQEIPLTDAFDVTFFIPMPKSWSKKRKAEMAGTPHQQMPDRDNLLKAFQDALTDDDSRFYDGRVAKYWATETGCIIYKPHEADNENAY